MSTRLDQMYTTIELACQTEDRSNAEQRDLLAFAIHVDNTANRLVTTNKRKGVAWRLHRKVEETRVLNDGQTSVVVGDALRAKLDKRADLWDRFADAYRRGEWTVEMSEAGA